MTPRVRVRRSVIFEACCQAERKPPVRRIRRLKSLSPCARQALAAQYQSVSEARAAPRTCSLGEVRDINRLSTNGLSSAGSGLVAQALLPVRLCLLSFQWLWDC